MSTRVPLNCPAYGREISVVNARALLKLLLIFVLV